MCFRQKTTLCLKVKKGRKFYVVKTKHLVDEAKILLILNKIKLHNIIIPRLYEHSRRYLVQDYIAGPIPNPEVVIKKLSFIRKILNQLHKILNLDKKLFPYTKDCYDNQNKKPISSNIWLTKRVKRWFSKKQSLKEYRFDKNSTELAIQYFNKVKTKTKINFGAFSEQHFRLFKNKIGIFDFGRHIRFAPEEYDWAYLWWGYFLDFAQNQFD